MGSDGFSSEDLELLALLLGQEAGPGEPPPTIRPRANPAERPLSFAQQRLWFFEQLNPDSHTFNNVWAVRLVGRLNLAALEATIEEIVRRHEVLRTSFGAVQGEPMQLVAPAERVSLPIHDLRHLPAAEREAEATRWALSEVQALFDLARGPLWRLNLLQLADEEAILLLTMHHITSDGWSMEVLGQEVAALYSAFVQGQPSPLPELPIQYADFAAWQRATLQGDALAQQLAYWTEQLRDLPTLALPTDFPRPDIQRYGGANQPFFLPPDVAAQLKALGQSEGATLFMVLLAAFKLVLAHQSGQRDIVVGTDVANRDQPEIEGLIGFFVNQLTLRTDLGGDPSFREVLRRVRDMARAAFAHQDVPFERVIQALNPERSLRAAPLFQVKLFLQHARPTEVQLPGLTLQPLILDPGIARLDLVWGLWDGAAGITGWLNFNTDLWAPATIAHMVEQLRSVLGEAITRPDSSLSALFALLAAQDEAARQSERERRAEAQRGKFKKGTRKTVDLT